MIESERKSARLIVGLFLVGLLLVSAFVLFQLFSPDTRKIQLGGERFVAEIASTPAAREIGLSNRADLAKDHAMVFTFDTDKNECFWMRGMKFAIDIVWLNDKNQVSAIEPNVDPSSYPKNFCHSGKYVIELKAGTVDELNIKVGDHVDL